MDFIFYKIWLVIHKKPLRILLNKLIIRLDAALKSTLNEQEVEILEKLKDTLTEQSSLSECEGFVNGFRLGVKLIPKGLC